MAESPWNLNKEIASLKAEGLQLQANIFSPDQGLAQIHFAGCALPHMQLLAVQHLWGENSKQADHPEAYIRQNDLIIDYPQPSGEARPQIYWRSFDAPPAAGIELILSIQTDLLESAPSISTLSKIPQAKIFQYCDVGSGRFDEIILDKENPLEKSNPSKGSSLFLFRLAEFDLSYIEMVYPADFHTASLQYIESDAEGADSHLELQYQLFQDSIEKGVIHRMRAQGWLLPRQGDSEQAAKIYHKLANSGPPLTT